jgi:hypothetical protein
LKWQTAKRFSTSCKPFWEQTHKFRAIFICIYQTSDKILDARLRGHDGPGDEQQCHSRESGNPVQ